jgi:tRNA wybutosine-synthesizing protein 2
MMQKRIDIRVPRHRVKSVKDVLESHGKLDKSRKIVAQKHDAAASDSQHLIPTLYSDALPPQVLQQLGLSDDSALVTSEINADSGSRTNAIGAAVRDWFTHLPEDRCSMIELDLLLRDVPKTYSIYHPMLLLPSNSFSSPAWLEVFKLLHDGSQLYEAMAARLNVSHVAINAPIPLLTSDQSPVVNALRSPVHINPIYGDFGKTQTSPPYKFDSCLWVEAKQNGIIQTWSPLHTMFSRGNIKEKARILSLPSVQVAANEGRRSGNGSAAVDMYAGIGYFAFSYLNAGIDRVLCWELNPWSVEGLRRGAGSNGWSICIAGNKKEADLDKQLVAFEADNQNAAAFVNMRRHEIPPIRHVNCGLLPSSRGSWEAAVDIIDPELGGWIHLHENLPVEDIDARGHAIAGEISRIGGCAAVVQQVERVKSYAPGIMHCVLDIYIPPCRNRRRER